MKKPSFHFKLFRLLSSLSQTEYNALCRMADSNFQKLKQGQIPSFLKFLKPFYPTFNDAKLTPEKLHKKFFQGQPFHRKPITDLFFHTNTLVEQFLLNEELKNNDRLRDYLVRKIYIDRQLLNDFTQKKGKFLKNIAATSTYEALDFLETWELQDRHYFAASNEIIELKNTYFLLAINALDRFYVLKKLEYANEFAINKKLITIDQSFLFQQELNLLDTNIEPFGCSPIFQIYQKIQQLYYLPDDVENFHTIKTTFQKNINKLSHSQQQTILIHLINFIFNQINHNRVEYYKDANELYKLGDQHQLLTNNETLKHITFLNIVDAAIIAKDLDWARLFIEKYQSNLFPENAENAIYTALASYHFAKRDFAETLVQLDKCQLSNKMYYVKINFLYLKTYFELLEVDAEMDEKFNKKIMAIEKFFYRKENIQDYRKQIVINGLKGCKTLYILKINPNLTFAEKEKLKSAILNKKRVAAYAWLKEKMETL